MPLSSWACKASSTVKIAYTTRIQGRGSGRLIYFRYADSGWTVLLETMLITVQMYAGYFLCLVLMLYFTLACRVWTRAKINYAFVFEFDTRDSLDWRQLAEVSPCCSLCADFELTSTTDPLLPALPRRRRPVAELPGLHTSRNLHLLAGHPHRTLRPARLLPGQDTLPPFSRLVPLCQLASAPLRSLPRGVS